MTDENKEILRQVEATMEISNMPLTEEAKQMLIDLLEGNKTHEEIIEEIRRKYSQE